MRLEQLIQGNDSVLQFVSSEREATELLAISSMAREAISSEILPQIEENVVSVESAEELCASTKRSIETAFTSKNEVYTRLIGYKGIDQSDDQFLGNLLVVMDEWLRSTIVIIKVENESTDPKQPLEIPLDDSSEELPISVADIFDLDDMRV